MAADSKFISAKLAVVAAALNPDIRSAVREARSLGFGGVQLDARTPELDLTTLSISGQRELRQIVRSHDLELESLRFDLGAKGVGPAADVDAVLASLDAVLASARGLQVPLVCVEIGPLPAPPRQIKPRPAIDPLQTGLILIPQSATSAEAERGAEGPQKLDETFAASVDGALFELGRRADRYGVMLAFRSELAGFAAIERSLSAAACEWFGVDLDPAAMLPDAWSADEILSRLGALIRHVRGRDAILGADQRTKPAGIGRGSVAWEALLALLDDADFSGWIAIDPLDLRDRRAAAIAGEAFLKEIPS